MIYTSYKTTIEDRTVSYGPSFSARIRKEK